MKFLRIFLIAVLFFGMAGAPIGCGGSEAEKKPAAEEKTEGAMKKAAEATEEATEAAEEATEEATE